MLAARAQLHRTYVAHVERGARNVSLSSIDKLAEALEVSVATLLSHGSIPGKWPNPPGLGSDGDSVDILLVEDSRSDVELTLNAFKKAQIANSVHIARDGAEAIDFLFAQGKHANRKNNLRPRLVLLDLNLPKVGGIEVLERMKASEATRSIPVIVLTASQKDRDFALCKRLGAETYIVKPVDFQKFSQATPKLNFTWSLLKPHELASV